jgi:hypothetical protein
MHFEVQADDIERAKAFYEKAFGWKIEPWKSKEKGMMEYWMVMTGPDGTPGINGGIYKRPAEDPVHTFDCTIAVENLDKAVQSVIANGGTITREKSELAGVGWFASAKDTEGNRFSLMQPTDWQPK